MATQHLEVSSKEINSKALESLETFQFAAKIQFLQAFNLHPWEVNDSGEAIGSYKHFYTSSWNPSAVKDHYLSFIERGYLVWRSRHTNPLSEVFLEMAQTSLKKAYGLTLYGTQRGAITICQPLHETFTIIHTALAQWGHELAGGVPA